MGKIFKRRNRRPLAVHKGSVRRTPNFYPQFYGDGGEMALQVIDGLERLAGAGMQVANSFGDGGWKFNGTDNTKKPMTVRTSFRKDAEGNYKTAEVGGADVANSAMAALQGAGELTKGAFDLADIADTTSVQDRIDAAFDSATDNQSLLASFGNTGNLKTDWSGKDLRGMTGGEKALGIVGQAATGAMAGAAAGSLAPPMGTAIGAAAGFMTGLGSGIGGVLAGDAKARRQAEHLNAQAEAANKYALNAFDSANQSLSDKNWRSNLVNLSAYGGQIGQDADGMRFHHDFPATGAYAHGGGIHINPANRGKFTEAASRAGMGTQEYARHVLANSGDYDATTVRRANFARNAAKWKHAYGGRIYDGEDDTRSLPQQVEVRPPVESTYVSGAMLPHDAIVEEEPPESVRMLTPDERVMLGTVPGLEEAWIEYVYPNDVQRRLAAYRHAAAWDMDYIPNGITNGFQAGADFVGRNAKQIAPVVGLLPYGGKYLAPMMYTLGVVYQYENNKDDPEYEKTMLRDAVPYYVGQGVGAVTSAFNVPNSEMAGTAAEQLTGYIMDKFDGQ